jgi:DNA polymerase
MLSKEFVDLKEEIINCNKCSLRENTLYPCWDNGNVNSKTMFVAEAPGKEEQACGIPLVGRAGQYFNRCLAGIGIERKDIFATNTCMCRPVTPNTQKDRPPTQEEINICSEYLVRQIDLIKPELIVAMGKTPFNFLTDSDDPIFKAKGNLYSYKNNTDIKVFPVLHPSYLISYSSPEIIANSWIDWLKLRRLIPSV